MVAPVGAVKNFDRDSLLELTVSPFSEIDLAHATATDRLQNPVAPDPLAFTDPVEISRRITDQLR